jgi:transcriptional regulator with XRE-family HTH domain
MNKKGKMLPNYLRVHRLRLGLTQSQVAELLGCAEDGSKVSRYERGVRWPSLKTALAFQAIYNSPMSKLFAGTYREIERSVERRARKVARKLLKPS